MRADSTPKRAVVAVALVAALVLTSAWWSPAQVLCDSGVVVETLDPQSLPATTTTDPAVRPLAVQPHPHPNTRHQDAAVSSSLGSAPTTALSRDSSTAPTSGLSARSIEKLGDPDFVAQHAARLSRHAVRNALARASGREAGMLAEDVFATYAGRLNTALEGSGSNYRVFLQQAARKSGRFVGRRVTAWNSHTGRWRWNTKRLDWIISDITSTPNGSGLYEALFGADFTVTKGGAFGVVHEYRRAFPNTRLIGIDPRAISGL